jgi:CheY-like chemotaxis protein
MNTPPLVLIVDDFADALDIYATYLSFKGYRVMTAASGAQAIAIAQEYHPAVILMDIRMALMTGTEAMRILRRDPQFSTVAIVAFTAHAFDDERVMALADGFDEVISKPCNPDDLVAAVQRLLSQSGHALT